MDPTRQVDPPLHAEIEPLRPLLGTWRGEGKGEFPTIDPFRYGEEMRFEHVGDPFLLYAQRSWLLDDGSPLHFERGFFRLAGPGRVEVTLAHPIGIVEVAEGPLEGRAIDLASTTIGLTGTASSVTDLRRRLMIEGDLLRYELSMAMEGVPLVRHVTSELRRMEA